MKIVEDIKQLLLELRNITLIAMAQSGIKKTSDLSKSVTFVETQDGIKMEVAEYYPYVSGGRSRTYRPARISKVPIDALIQWIRAKGIVPRTKMTTNQLAFAIQSAIYYKGIKSNKPVKGKNFADRVAEDVSDFTAEQVANYMAESIADDLVEMFNV